MGKTRIPNNKHIDVDKFVIQVHTPVRKIEFANFLENFLNDHDSFYGVDWIVKGFSDTSTSHKMRTYAVYITQEHADACLDECALVGAVRGTDTKIDLSGGNAAAAYRRHIKPVMMRSK